MKWRRSPLSPDGRRRLNLAGGETKKMEGRRETTGLRVRKEEGSHVCVVRGRGRRRHTFGRRNSQGGRRRGRRSRTKKKNEETAGGGRGSLIFKVKGEGAFGQGEIRVDFNN